MTLASINDLDEYEVVLKDHGADVDLTGKVSVLEYEDSATQNVRITLNARDGRYIASDPVIRQWDRIFVRIKPKTGSEISDVFHVKVREKRRTPGRVEQYVLHCPHQSSNLWARTIGLPARRVSGRTALNRAVDILNASRGDDDPEVEVPGTFDEAKKTGNRFDPNTANDYIFEAVPFQSVADELAQRELNPPEGGGSFEAMYVRFKSKFVAGGAAADLGKVYLQAFPQGYHLDTDGNWNSTPDVTLIYRVLGADERPNILSFDSDLAVEKGTNIMALGDKTSGTYPTDHSRYSGARDVWDGIAPWVSGQRYEEGTLVRYDDETFECITSHDGTTTAPAAGTRWASRTFQRPDDWATGTSYAKHASVSYRGIAYKCLEGHTAASDNHPQADEDKWRRISWLPAVHYSPLTNQKAQYWINALGGARWAGTNNGRTAMIDPTVIISDGNHPRTWVDWVGTDPDDIPDVLKYRNGNVPHRFRVLVADPPAYRSGPAPQNYAGEPNTWTASHTGEGDFSGDDAAGHEFAGNIAVYDDPDLDGTGTWRVKRVCPDDQEVYDFYEGISWTKNPHLTGFYIRNSAGGQDDQGTGTRHDGWVAGSYTVGETLGTDAVNILKRVGNAIGLLAVVNAVETLLTDDDVAASTVGPGNQALSFSRAKQFDCVHPVKWDGSQSRIDCGNERLLAGPDAAASAVFIKSAPSPFTQRYYVGLNLRPQWPPNRISEPYEFTSSEDIGDVINLREFDLDNMHRDHEGRASWLGQGAEDYFPIHGFSFWQRLTVLDALLLGNPQIAGDYKMGIWLADDDDNVVILPYTQKRNGTTVAVDVPLSARQFFEAVRSGYSWISAPEPEVLNVFDQKRWVIGGIFTMDSFDEQGRSLDLFSRFNTATEMKLSVDAFRMAKPLVCTTADEDDRLPGRNIEPQKVAAEKITSYGQLKNYVLGLERLYNFDRDEYIIETKGKGDVAFGDPVYVEDPHLLEDGLADGDHKVRAVADRITYSVSKGKGGPGGFRRTVHAVTRVWP